VDTGQLAGAAALIARDGAIDAVTAGRRDLRSGLPVERDTIFRIASLSKPITTVAALSMFDEGRLSLDEPITRCAPEFAHLRVLREPEGSLDQCDDAIRPRGGVGTIGWPGAYGGWWQADPNDQSVFVFLTHNMMELQQMARGIGLEVWDAIGRLHSIATS